MEGSDSVYRRGERHTCSPNAGRCDNSSPHFETPSIPSARRAALGRGAHRGAATEGSWGGFITVIGRPASGQLAGAFMLNVFTLQRPALPGRDRKPPGARQGPAGGRPHAPTDEEKGLIAEHPGLTIPSDAVDDDSRSASTRKTTRAAHPLRLPDRRRRDGATSASPSSCTQHPVPRSMPRTRRCFTCCAQRAPDPGADRRRQGRPEADDSTPSLGRRPKGLRQPELVSARAAPERRRQGSRRGTRRSRQEDPNGRIRRNVMDTRRAVSFMMRSRLLGG
jgi:magnesium transporter